MNKIVFTVVAIVLLNLVPLVGKPELLTHYKTVVLVIAAAALWLSQPAFSTKDTKSNRSSDKFSIVIILIMSSTSVLSGVVEWGYFTDQISSVVLTVMGFLMLVTGVLIRVWAINVLGKHFTATATLNQDHQLIRVGPYKLVRHPSYLGAFLAIIGSAVFLNAPVSIIIATVCMSIAYYIRISVEEQMLASYFGKQYDEYKLKTKRFIPFIW